jgi:hypothetical protein
VDRRKTPFYVVYYGRQCDIGCFIIIHGYFFRESNPP